MRELRHAIALDADFVEVNGRIDTQNPDAEEPDTVVRDEEAVPSASIAMWLGVSMSMASFASPRMFEYWRASSSQTSCVLAAACDCP